MVRPCVPRRSVARGVVSSKLVKVSRWATRYILEIYYPLAFGAVTERFPLYCFGLILFIQHYQRKDHFAYVAPHDTFITISSFEKIHRVLLFFLICLLSLATSRNSSRTTRMEPDDSLIGCKKSTLPSGPTIVKGLKSALAAFSYLWAPFRLSIPLFQAYIPVSMRILPHLIDSTRFHSTH